MRKAKRTKEQHFILRYDNREVFQAKDERGVHAKDTKDGRDVHAKDAKEKHAENAKEKI